MVKQVGSYKKQIEEAEEISTINLCKQKLSPQNIQSSKIEQMLTLCCNFMFQIFTYKFHSGKYRRVEGELVGAEDRAGMRENVLSR